MLANEVLYASLIISMFMFSDATPQMDIKYGAGVAIDICLLLIVAIFIAFNVYLIWKGRDALKKDATDAKAARSEFEAIDQAESDERKARKKKDDDADQNEPGPTPIDGTVSRDVPNENAVAKKRNSRKRKENADDVMHSDSVAGVSNSDFSEHRRRRNDKARQDDVVEGTENDAQAEAEGRRKKRRKRKAVDED